MEAMIVMPLRTRTRAAGPEELAEARAALAVERQRLAALSLFARQMSHDMSNLVTVVLTYSELLLAELPAGEPSHADVREILRAADAMIDYIHRIAQFSKAGNGQLAAVRFDEAIADAVQDNPLGERLQCTFDSRSLVHIDKGGLVAAVREIVANALEAAPGQSRVWVRTWCESLMAPVVDGGLPIEAGGWAVLEVADEGAGFGAGVRDTATDPFVTTKNAVRGAGFGLTLARSAAWGAGGQLVIDSQVTLPGARVRLWLPMA